MAKNNQEDIFGGPKESRPDYEHENNGRIEHGGYDSDADGNNSDDDNRLIDPHLRGIDLQDVGFVAGRTEGPALVEGNVQDTLDAPPAANLPGYRIKSTPTYLSSSHHGSRRHLRQLAINALVLVSEMGPPTNFNTLTCNTAWSEIKDKLFPGQTAYDRPDVVCMVFKQRLMALFKFETRLVYILDPY